MDAGNEEVLSRAAAWVHNCVENHEHCNASTAPLPSRLLDLNYPSSPDGIRLWEAEGAHGHYATLSHCWGESGHFTTSRASIAARKQGIKLEEMPKTFQDAVIIARRVGMQYLWIDSLCICQDDSEDWARESANMAAIYTNSYLTIAAAGAESNSAGCFTRCPEIRYIPIDLTMENGMSGEFLAFRLPLDKAALHRRYLEMSDQPLTTRAWALQERLMAHRVLHYCKDQMRYECNEEFLTEDGIYEDGRRNSLFPSHKPIYEPLLRRSQHSADHALWYRLLWDYTSRRLTKPSDKLPALSGLARKFASRLRCEYVAGLWSNALIEGLSWQGLRERGDHKSPSTSAYIAPSWSWASYTGIAATGFTGAWKYIATILDYHVELKSANPYGEVSDGWIRLQGPLLPLSLSEVPETEDEKLRHAVMRLKTPWSDPVGHGATFDSINQRDEGARALVMSLRLFGLILAQKEASDEDVDGGFYYTLIVAENGSSSAKGRMRRVGWMFLDREPLGNTKVIDDSSEFSTVTLV